MGKAPYVSKHRLDRTSVDMIKRTYMPGTRVEAVSVQNIARGMKGVVREADESGLISVIWKNGDMTNVIFGMDSIKVESDGCLLGRSMSQGGCEGTYCSRCGWNERIHRKRIERIQNGELKEMPNGVKGLVVKDS